MKPFRYYGGKARIASQIIAMMPKHSVYIEPFLGSGAIISAKRPAAHELVNDLDHRIATFFTVMRDRTDELVEALRLTPYARTEFEHCRDTEWASLDDDIETARRFFVTITQSFAATSKKSSGWSASMKKSVNRARSTQHAVDRLHSVAARFRDVQIECRPAWDVIDNYATGLGDSAVIYCDPPYVHATRSGGRTNGHGYAHEMDDSDHERLAESLHAATATVLLSGYRSDLYDYLYGDWTRSELATTATVGESGGRSRTEVVWSNRPVNSQLDLFKSERLPSSGSNTPTNHPQDLSSIVDGAQRAT